MLLQENSELIRYDALYRTSCLTVAELLFCLSFELRLTDLDADDRSQSLTDIISA